MRKPISTGQSRHTKERLRLIAQSVKFPTAEAMYDFINQKYNEYLLAEGAKLESFTHGSSQPRQFPDGRRRRETKSISQSNIRAQLLPAWDNQELHNCLQRTSPLVNHFANNSNSLWVGGGTGSGIFFEFARHLRKMLGSGVPIIGLVVTPCGRRRPTGKRLFSFRSHERTVTLAKQRIQRNSHQKIR